MDIKGSHINIPIEAREHLERAYGLEEANQFHGALHECAKAVHLAPQWAEAHNLRGIILDGMGRKVEAYRAYREAVRLTPDFQEALDNLSEAEAELGALVTRIDVCANCGQHTEDTTPFELNRFGMLPLPGPVSLMMTKKGKMFLCPECHKFFSRGNDYRIAGFAVAIGGLLIVGVVVSILLDVLGPGGLVLCPVGIIPGLLLVRQGRRRLAALERRVGF